MQGAARAAAVAARVASRISRGGVARRAGRSEGMQTGCWERLNEGSCCASVGIGLGFESFEFAIAKSFVGLRIMWQPGL